MATFQIILIILSVIIQTGVFLDCRIPGRQRIIGGQNTTIDQHPYQVAMISKNGEEDVLMCGATIVSQYWALSATHCTLPPLDKYYQEGTVYLRGNVSIWSRRVDNCDHKVTHVINHPAFASNTYDYDISLYKVFEPFTCLHESTVKVASKNYLYNAESNSVISGWGYSTTDIFASPEEALRSTTIKLVPEKDCSIAYMSDLNNAIPLSSRQLCAWDVGQDSCQGDSGGPMVQNEILIGLVSAGVECNSSTYPGVYTKLGEFYDWIQEIDKEFSANLKITYADNPCSS